MKFLRAAIRSTLEPELPEETIKSIEEARKQKGEPDDRSLFYHKALRWIKADPSRENSPKPDGVVGINSLLFSQGRVITFPRLCEATAGCLGERSESQSLC